jgi:ribosome maturation factor RimP
MSQIENIEEILNSCDLELYDIETTSENSKAIYRISVVNKDITTPVTLNKCEEVSKLISPLLDLNPPIKGEYFLEVSSAGIERKLSKPKHFALSIGSLVKINLFDTTNIDGKILSANESEVEVECEDGSIEKILFDDINRAKTYWKW